MIYQMQNSGGDLGGLMKINLDSYWYELFLAYGLDAQELGIKHTNLVTILLFEDEEIEEI